MTTMRNEAQERYWQGVDAAIRALDRTGMTAADLLRQWRDAESRHRAAEKYLLAEYAKGFGDTVQEFIDDQGDRNG